MQVVSWFVGCGSMLEAAYEMIANARLSIYLCTSFIDVNAAIGNTHLSTLLAGVCARGVTVHLLMPEGSAAALQASKLPSACRLCVADNFGPTLESELVFWTATVSNLVRQAQLHGGGSQADAVRSLGDRALFRTDQHYLLVDDKLVLLGPLRFLDERQARDRHGVGAVVSVEGADPAAAAFVRFAHDNFATRGRACLETRPLSKGQQLRPGESRLQWLSSSPSVRLPDTDESRVLCAMINECQDYLYLESEYLISYSATHNTVAEWLARRIVRAHRQGASDPFRCLLLVNTDADPLRIGFGERQAAKKLHLTLEYLLNAFDRAQILPKKLRGRIFVGRLQPSASSAYQHAQSLVCIQDGERCLVSGGSSVCDRALAGQNAELAVLVEGRARVSSLEQLIWKSLLCVSASAPTSTDALTFDVVFDQCLSGQAAALVKVKKEPTVKSRVYAFSDVVLRTVGGFSVFT